MPAQADIIVSSPDSTEVKLVVEAKLRLAQLSETERQLKLFMLQLRSPLGVLVSPQRLAVYVDRYTSDTEDSVERIGEFNTEELLGIRSFDRESEFESSVQSWLEGLTDSMTRLQIKDPKFREIVDYYLLPAIEGGIVRAAGPR